MTFMQGDTALVLGLALIIGGGLYVVVRIWRGRDGTAPPGDLPNTGVAPKSPYKRPTPPPPQKPGPTGTGDL